MSDPQERREAAIRGAHKGDAAKNWDFTEHQLGEAYDAFLKYFGIDQKPLADIIRYGIGGGYSETRRASHGTHYITRTFIEIAYPEDSTVESWVTF
jgi:hypothetical protein